MGCDCRRGPGLLPRASGQDWSHEGRNTGTSHQRQGKLCIAGSDGPKLGWTVKPRQTGLHPTTRVRTHRHDARLCCFSTHGILRPTNPCQQLPTPNKTWRSQRAWWDQGEDFPIACAIKASVPSAWSLRCKRHARYYRVFLTIYLRVPSRPPTSG